MNFLFHNEDRINGTVNYKVQGTFRDDLKKLFAPTANISNAPDTISTLERDSHVHKKKKIKKNLLFNSEQNKHGFFK